MPPESPETGRQETVHLVLGDAAAGCLRTSWRFPGGQPGEVLVFHDVLALGPLSCIDAPGEADCRAAYWQTIMPGPRDDATEMAAEAQRYRDAARIAHQGTRLTVWHGDHASSALWLQRLASVLPTNAQLDLIDVSRATFPLRAGPIRALGQVPPVRVADLQGLTFTLGRDRLADLARRWRENAARDSGLRRCRDGAITHHGADYYDDLVLASCGTDWRPAPRVVGETMEAADEILGDWFFASRLRCLAQAGRLVLAGEYGEDLAFRVRLP